MALLRLIYVSAAIRELSDEELDAILDSSVRRNKPEGITGMLLYSKGNFMQVLEGDAAVVDATYERIRKDSRHTQLFLLTREPIAARDFSRWSMGFRRLSAKDAEDSPAFAHLLLHGFEAEEIGAQPGLALNMLKEFSRN